MDVNSFTFDTARRMYDQRQLHLWQALEGLRLTIESQIRQTSMTEREMRSTLVTLPTTMDGLPDYDIDLASQRISDWLRHQGMQVTRVNTTTLRVDWTNASGMTMAGRANVASANANKALAMAFERMYTDVSVEIRKACTLGAFESWIEIPAHMTGYVTYDAEEARDWLVDRGAQCGFLLQKLDQSGPRLLYWSFYDQTGLPKPKAHSATVSAEERLAFGDVAHTAMANPHKQSLGTPIVRATANIFTTYAGVGNNNRVSMI